MCNKGTNRYIPVKVRIEVVVKQYNKCANSPDNPAKNLTGCPCPRWILYNGYFCEEAGYEIDHIEEFSITGNNSIDNLQALCSHCHSVKTHRFNKNKRKLTSPEMANGKESMDTGSSKTFRKQQKIRRIIQERQDQMEIVTN
jgi:hypothetical protein